jgi:hypothetical protein
MRKTPNYAQMKYLTSIGILETTLSQPIPATADSPDVNHKVATNSGSHAGQWWAVFLVIVVLLLLIVAVSHGAELETLEDSVSASVDQIETTTDQVWIQKLNSIDVEVKLLRESLSRAAKYEDLIKLQGQLKSLEERLTTFRDVLMNDCLLDHEILAYRIACKLVKNIYEATLTLSLR